MEVALATSPAAAERKNSNSTETHNMKYTSKQVQIYRPEELIYRALSNFEHFTPILADKVEAWEATEERCSFRAKGFTVGLKMVEKEPNSLIKITGDEEVGAPIPMTFWIQMKETETSDPEQPDTRLRIVLDVELNMMMKMMIGKKLQGAVDQIADQIAYAFNNAQI